MGARVHLCGRLEVEWDGEGLEGAFPGRQGRLLFAFLALHRDRLVRRDELVEALWSEEGPPPGGDALLRAPLSRLRSALGPGRLEGRGELAIRFPEDTWIDREAVRDGLRQSRAAGDARAAWEAAREALALAERGLLPGLEARWLDPFRTELEEQRIGLLEAVGLAGARLGDGELPEAEQAARRAIEAAPFRESARVALLQILRRRGNVAEALVAFDEFRTFLRDELGTAPGQELLALHGDLLRAERAPAGRQSSGRLVQAPAKLVEREQELAALEDAIAAGGVVAIIGEPGIGKTALTDAACAGAERAHRGACDPLVTARSLGPVWDVAHAAGGPLLAALEDGAPREAVLQALLDVLTDSLVIMEDLHWVDDATLDLLVLAARRMERGALLVTCREGRPELGRLLALAACRIHPAPLSAEAVTALGVAAGRDGAAVHAATGGNPFLVSELLAAPPGAAVPGSVRDAIAARLAGLDPPARQVVELVAVAPGGVEPELPAQTVGVGAEAADAAIAAGLLELHGDLLAFRHDLARQAVEDAIPPLRRRSLDRMVLQALEGAGSTDVARLAHHARRSGDARAIARHAPRAARAAAAAGAHRQALEHWEAALAAGGELEEALEGVANEAYLSGRAERALSARRDMLALHEAAGDRLRAGDDLRWIARALWWSGSGAEAAEASERAMTLLEAYPDSRELALALSGGSQLAMLAGRTEEAIALGERAIALGRRIGDRETVAHALTNVGTAMLGTARHEEGRALLEQAHVLAADAGHEDHAARALVNLAITTMMRRRDDPRIPADLERALAYTRPRGLDGYVQYLLGGLANVRVRTGDWASAEDDAREALAIGEVPGVSLCPTLLALGRLQARRGDEAAAGTLAEAWRRAIAAGEPQRLAPTAAARAELGWLEGDAEACVQAAREGLDHADGPWSRGELAFWLWRAGALDAPPADIAGPYEHLMAGDWRGAAAAWERLGCPYEAAEALSEGDEAARLDALARFERLGAAQSAARLRRRLRDDQLRRRRRREGSRAPHQSA